MWWLIFPAIVVAFLAVVLIRTAAFKPKAETRPEPDEVELDGQKAIDDLAEMIRCKTVSYRDQDKIDFTQFEKFQKTLERLYPNVHKTCTLEHIGKTGLLYRFRGKSEDKPSVLMAHYDVVPIVEEGWEKDAFAGIIEDGVLWGRGTLDTKGTLCGVMESVETLISSGFTPEHDIYMAFAGDEEIAGDTQPAIVEELHRRGITPELVVDEGGAVVDNLFPGVTRPCAVIGTGEKGMMDLEFVINSKGGHASAPPTHTIVGELAEAVTRVEGKPFKKHLTKPVAEMFDTLGRHSSFVYRMIFANLWCFGGLLDSLCRKKGGELNALMRTTCAFTQMEGSKASNVLPPHARLVANLRLMGGDTTESAQEYLRGVIGNEHVEIKMLHGMNPSIFSSTDCPGWEKLCSAVGRTWPDAIVSPYLMVACSDSRHYCRISDKVYRFSAMALSGEERGMIHGNNERIPVDKIVTTAKFYVRLVSQL